MVTICASQSSLKGQPPISPEADTNRIAAARSAVTSEGATLAVRTRSFRQRASQRNYTIRQPTLRGSLPAVLQTQLLPPQIAVRCRVGRWVRSGLRMMRGTNELGLRTAIRVGTPWCGTPAPGSDDDSREFGASTRSARLLVIDQRETLQPFPALLRTVAPPLQ